MTRIILYIALLILFVTQPALAKSSDWDQVEDAAQVRLVAGNGGTFGLQFSLKPHWHTYWRTPGDGGLAPNVSYTNSKNLKKAEFLYPGPTRFEQVFEGYDPIETFGYADEVVFPIIVEAKDPSKPVELAVSADFGVCNEICIFHNSKFNLTIDPNYADQPNLDLIKKYLTQTPSSSKENGMAFKDVRLVDDNVIEVDAASSTSLKNASLFVEAGENFRFIKPSITLSADGKSATFSSHYEILLSGLTLSPEDIVLTLVNDGKTLEKKSQ